MCVVGMGEVTCLDMREGSLVCVRSVFLCVNYIWRKSGEVGLSFCLIFRAREEPPV